MISVPGFLRWRNKTLRFAPGIVVKEWLLVSDAASTTWRMPCYDPGFHLTRFHPLGRVLHGIHVTNQRKSVLP